MSLSLAAVCHPSKITRCPGRLLAKCLQWSWKPIGAASRAQPARGVAEVQQAQMRFLSAGSWRCSYFAAHGALFSQQLLDLTHRWWTERADTDIDIKDIHRLAAAVYIHMKLHSERYPGRAPFQLPDPLQPARSLTDLLTAVAALLARRKTHNAPLLHSAWTVKQVITEECRILESVHCELGTLPPAAWILVLEKRLSVPAVPAGFPQSPRPVLARVPSGVLASGAQGIADIYVQNRPFSVESKPSCMLRWLGLVFLPRASSQSPDIASDPLLSVSGDAVFFLNSHLAQT